jgi:PIN domain nuclease of toxin-antitoxin system
MDTHAWLWWTDDPDRLSPAARTAIEEADAIGVPTICCWELTMLVERRRIELAGEVRSWVRDALGQDRVRPILLTAPLAVEAALLEREGFVGDPADRIVYASARANRAPLVTKDRRLREFDPALAVW